MGTNQHPSYQGQRTSCCTREGIACNGSSIYEKQKCRIVDGASRVNKDAKLKDDPDSRKQIVLPPRELVVSVKRDIWGIDIGISDNDDRRSIPCPFNFLRVRVLPNRLAGDPFPKFRL